MIRNGVIIVALILGVCIRATGQTPSYPHDVPLYPFIQYAQNVLQFPGDTQALEPLFNKLDRLIFEGKGKVNMLHMGGSHVQADIISGRMRERLATFYPGNKGSRGLVFPYRVAGTNNPGNYFVSYTGKWDYCKNVGSYSCELGLAGISVFTGDTTATLKIALKQENYPAFDFNRIRVFHKADSNLMLVVVKNADTSKLRYTRNWAEGYTDIDLGYYTSTIELGLQKKDSNSNWFALYGLQLENDDPGITYHAVGVNGAGTYSYLKCSLLEQHARWVAPDLVIFGIGINDAASSKFDPNVFERNYQSLMEKLKRANPEVRFLFITNNDSFKKYKRKYYVNKNGELVRNSMFKLAQKYNAVVWDQFTIMGGLESMATWQKSGLAQADKIHFTATGYRLLGDLMFSAFLKAYENHLQKKYPNTQSHPGK